MKHPSNNKDIFKGRITEHYGYACLIRFDERIAYLFDRRHDECEMFNPKQEL